MSISDAKCTFVSFVCAFIDHLFLELCPLLPSLREFMAQGTGIIFVNQIVLLRWIISFHCSPIHILEDSPISGRHALFYLLDPTLERLMLPTSYAVSLNSLSSGSMKSIPHNFHAFSRWSFSFDHFCFSFNLACFPIDFQSPGHGWSGLDVSCFLVNLPPDHTSVKRFLCQQSKLCETCPRIWQAPWSIDIPVITDAFSCFTSLEKSVCFRVEQRMILLLSASKIWL